MDIEFLREALALICAWVGFKLVRTNLSRTVKDLQEKQNPLSMSRLVANRDIAVPSHPQLNANCIQASIITAVSTTQKPDR